MIKKKLTKKLIIWFCNKEAKTGNLFPLALYDSPGGYLIEFVNISFNGNQNKINQYINTISKYTQILHYILSLLHLDYTFYFFVNNLFNNYGETWYNNTFGDDGGYNCLINKLNYLKENSTQVYLFKTIN